MTTTEPTGRLPTSIRSRALLLLATVVTLAFARWAASIVVPILLATLFTIGFWPIVRRVRGPSWLGVVVTIASVGLTLTGLGWIVLDAAGDFAGALADYGQAAAEARQDLVVWLATHGLRPLALSLQRQNPSELAEAAIGPLLATGADVVLLLAGVGGLTVVMLVELRALRGRLRDQGPAWREVVTRIDRRTEAVQRYLLVKAFTSTLTGLLAGGLTWTLDVPHPTLWGLLAFVLNFVPVVGSYVAGIPAVVVAALTVGPRAAALATVGYFVISGAIGFGVEPRLAGTAVGLSPLVVVLSILFWGWMFGPIGALASVPLTMVFRVFLAESESLAWLAALMDSSAAATDEAARSSRVPLPRSSGANAAG